MTVLGLRTYDLGGIGFNRQDGDGVKWPVSKITGWWDPPPSASTITDREGGHGASRGPTWYRRRTVTLEGMILGPDRARTGRAVERLAAVIGDGGFYRFEVADVDLGMRWAEVQRDDVKVDWPGQTWARFQVTVVAPDHRKYGAEEARFTPLPEVETPAGLDDTGNLDDTGGLNDNSSVQLGVVTVRNAGYVQSDPRFYARGGSTGLTGPVRIIHNLTGRVLEYAGDVGPSDYVLLDAGPSKAVLYNGYASRRDLLTRADWPTVPPGGTTSFSWEHAGGSTGDGQLEVRTAAAYL